MTRTRAESYLVIMEHLRLAGVAAHDLIPELQEAGDEGLALAFMGLHRRVRNLCDTTFAIYEDEMRQSSHPPQRDLEASPGDYPKGPQ